MFALRHVSDQSSSPPLALDLSLVLTLAAAKRREKRRQRSRPSVAIKAETHIFSFRNKPQGTSAVLVSKFVVILVSRGTIGCPTGDQRATHAQRFRFWIPFSLSLPLFACLTTVYLLLPWGGLLGSRIFDFLTSQSFFIRDLNLDWSMHQIIGAQRWSLSIGLYLNNIERHVVLGQCTSYLELRSVPSSGACFFMMGWSLWEFHADQKLICDFYSNVI